MRQGYSSCCSHLLLMSSGPMYSGVPMRMVFMLDVCIQCLANPKSHSFTHGGLRPSSSVLSSFRSLRQGAAAEGGDGCVEGGVKKEWGRMGSMHLQWHSTQQRRIVQFYAGVRDGRKD